MKLYLYELIDSIKAEPFYIGVSSDPERRLFGHIGRRSSKAGDKWEKKRSARISKVIDSGGQICLNIIGECDPEYRKMAESYFYITYVLNGIKLIQSPLKAFLQRPDTAKLKMRSNIYNYRYCCDNPDSFNMCKAPKIKKILPAI